jgi:HEPN domain-containing protein
MPDKINCEKIINHWIKSSKHDFETAEFLFKGKRYPECLFFCHLTIEKILKGLIVAKTKKQPPYIHYLDKLALETGIDFTEEQMNQFKIITTFNIRA